MPTTTPPMTATTSTQMQTTEFAATAIPVTIHKLITGQFAEASSPIARPQNGGHPSVQNHHPSEDIPKAPVRQGTPWPNAQSNSENLFETQKDWSIPPAPVPISALTMKTEAPPLVAAIPRAMDTPRQATKNCHTAPFAKLKKNMEKRIGMAIYKISQECAPKPSTPDHMKPSAAELPMPTAINPTS